MRDPIRRFKTAAGRVLAAALAGTLAWGPVPVHAETGEALPLQSVNAEEIGKTKQSLYADIFDQVFYEEGVQFLRLRDLARKITFTKPEAWNVNIYEEVPDSLFFTNRHGRKSLSAAELKEGPKGPAPARGKWTVIRGKGEGVNTGFFVRDSAGNDFLLKFDPIDYPEMSTAAEAVSSRIFHAAGYNVPAYHLVKFNLEDLEVAPDARYYDDTGFEKPLTKDKVEELLLFVARNTDDSFRASASSLLKGKIKGPFHIDGHRKNDPNDSVPHRFLREIRAIRVFCSWVDYYDMRTGNTLDVVETVGGKEVLKHYVIDYSSTLGSAGYDPKPPQFGHEYLFDFGEFFKSVFALGFWKKPWQKRWDENDRTVTDPSLGYFDNRYFHPGKWKNQIPYHAFKDLTASDGYWAAKIVMSFTDEDIAALVQTAEFSDGEAGRLLTKLLTERRDLIGKYWFGKSTPADRFVIKREAGGVRVEGTDLVSHYRLDPAPRAYRYAVHGSSLKGESSGPSVLLQDSALAGLPETFVLCLQSRNAEGKWAKPVELTLQKDAAEGLKLTRIRRKP
ncbi:MAG: hypothetical protein HY714_06625 [Candidatus Omnitrophica bacterium]|nr:hypothetical protein [Candidatus Omnitrophota bacterium]